MAKKVEGYINMAKDVLKEYPQLKIAVQRRQLYAKIGRASCRERV